MRASLLIKNIFMFILLSFAVSQNFIYESEDWLILKNPGAIYSITEGPFDLYFGTENGIFRYNKFDEFIEYDYKLNQGLDVQSSIYYIDYDNYSDQIWIITQDGIYYKNTLFNEYQKVRHHTIDSYNLSSITAMGSINKYIIIQYMSSYIVIDSFSGTIQSDVNIDINDVSWSASSFAYTSSDIDLSTYYAEDWLIGFRQITDSYGNEESVIVAFEDRDLNLWFGTNNGKLLKGFKYSNKLDIHNIGPISNVITSTINDNNQNWYIASDGQSYQNRYHFHYNKQSSPFLSMWNEYDDSWVYLNESDFSEISNPIINCMLNIDDQYLALGTMEGVIVTSFEDYKRYNYIDKRDGINDDIILDLEYYNQNMFIMTYKGISVYSLANDIIVEKNILTDYGLQDSDMLDMLIIDDKLFFSSRAGLFQFDITNRILDKISSNIFLKIDFHDRKILGLNQSLWSVDYLNNKEDVIVFRTNGARDFLIFNDYVWLNQVDRLKLINLDSKEQWLYNHNDGFVDIQIFDLGKDSDWVYFLTNQGIIYYNWREYHY